MLYFYTRKYLTSIVIDFDRYSLIRIVDFSNLLFSIFNSIIFVTFFIYKNVVVKMMKMYLLLVFCFIIASSLKAQENQNEFKPSANPVVLVFANYHAGFGSRNDLSGFEINRAYLGYLFQLSPNLNAKVVIDAAVAPEESFMISQKKETHIKNAQLTWADKGFTINGGMIGVLQFRLQEKFWEHRYVEKTFQDLYGMGSSADLGVSVEYNFTPRYTIDLSMTNGEGYKNLNMNNKYRYALGMTFCPQKDLSFRIYGDIFQHTLEGKNQRTLAFFAGYKCDYFSLGTEYNYQENNRFLSDMDYFGYSIFTTIPFQKKWNLIGRYDNIESKNVDNKSWINYTGSMVIAGIEYIPMKNLRFALNYRHIKYLNAESSAFGIYNSGYLNVEFLW